MVIQYANITKLENDLTDIADTIRTKTGKNEKLNFPQGYINEIGNNFYNNNDFADLTQPKGELYSTSTTPGWNYCCYNRTGITKLNFPNAKQLNKQAFWKCSGITSVYLPKVEWFAESALRDCPLLMQIVLPYNWWIGNYGIVSTGLTSLDMGQYTTTNSNKGIATYGLYGCTSLNLLVLRRQEVIPLLNVSGLGQTPFSSGKAGGTLYVPQDMIEEYQNTTNWSTILSYTKNGESQNKILSIEGSIYETKYIDGSDIE